MKIFGVTLLLHGETTSRGWGPSFPKASGSRESVIAGQPAIAPPSTCTVVGTRHGAWYWGQYRAWAEGMEPATSARHGARHGAWHPVHRTGGADHGWSPDPQAPGRTVTPLRAGSRAARPA